MLLLAGKELRKQIHVFNDLRQPFYSEPVISFALIFFSFRSSLLAMTESHLLITFANSLDLDQDRHALGSKLMDILKLFLKEVFEKVNFEKSQQMTKKCSR